MASVPLAIERVGMSSNLKTTPPRSPAAPHVAELNSDVAELDDEEFEAVTVGVMVPPRVELVMTPVLVLFKDTEVAVRLGRELVTLTELALVVGIVVGAEVEADRPRVVSLTLELTEALEVVDSATEGETRFVLFDDTEATGGGVVVSDCDEKVAVPLIGA